MIDDGRLSQLSYIHGIIMGIYVIIQETFIPSSQHQPYNIGQIINKRLFS